MQDWVDRHGFLFVLAVIAIAWLLVSLVISYTGGWASLAQEFRCRGEFAGRQYYGYSGYMRWLAHYRNCLIVGANHQGLYLAVLFLFRLAHPPLFIPWREISVMRRRLLFIPMVRFQLGRALSIPFWVHKSVANKLRDAAGAEWPKESNG